MARLTRQQVSQALARYYSEKFQGKVWSGYDASKRAYYIRGEGLPAAPALRIKFPLGWSLLDFIKPTKARQLVEQRQTEPR